MIYVDSSITSHVILQINLFLNPSEMSVWQYRILITFYMMVLQCSQWLRRQNISIYAMLSITMNLGFMMSLNFIGIYYFRIARDLVLSTKLIIDENLLRIKYHTILFHKGKIYHCVMHARLTQALRL